MIRSSLSIAFTLSGLLFPWSSFAQIIALQDADLNPCIITPGGVNLDVIVIGVGVKGARFAISPASQCGADLYSIVPAPGVDIEGEPETGITLRFACANLPLGTKVATLSFVVIDVECCPISVEPHPASQTGGVELIGCDDSPVEGWGGRLMLGDDGDHCGGFYSSKVPPAQGPDPPHLAQAVPIDQKLSFIQPTGWSCDPLLYGDIVTVYFGTESPPPMVCSLCPLEGGDEPREWIYDPGELEANTTYYWRVGYSMSGYGSAMSEEWAFTTDTGSPVQGQTWGRLKDLYKQE